GEQPMRTCSTSGSSRASTWGTKCRTSTRQRSALPWKTSREWWRSRSHLSMTLEMLTLRRGRVTAVVERVEGLARLEVDGEACIAYPRLTGPVALGDEVIVNTQARD